MAYDLSSFYSNTLSANKLSKTIVDQMMADKRFSSLSKITLGGLNYPSGGANSTPIGFTETGRPIYDTSVSATMNDDLLAAIEKMHTRNNDTMLRGIGTNVIENTSTGNIVAFASNGVYKAFITEDGRFTGKIRLENIEDLNKLTLDTSRFYIKDEVNALLAAKLSKVAIFNDVNKIKSELLDADIVRHVTFDPHNNDAVRHITGVERSNWNAKYLKPNTGIPETDLATVFTDRVKASALNSDLVNHTSNSDIHTSTKERAKWNAKYDKPSTGIPMTDFSEIVQNEFATAAKKAEVAVHTNNTDIHLTAEERIKWNAKYDKPADGIPKADLDDFVVEILENSATVAQLGQHTSDTVVHITNGERLKWNAQYTKPATGIPESDLDSAVRSLINKASTKEELNNHATNQEIHIKATEREAWNLHKSDNVVHITAEERTAWKAKYDKPSNGIPETDLSTGLQTKINNMVTNTDFNQHSTDTVRHVTASERTAWNSKYDKPNTGIPRADLAESIVKQLDASATQADMNIHIADSAKHVSSLERTTWNAQYTKPADGIPETDLTLALQTKIAEKASVTALSTHTIDTVKHITSSERVAWNSKYDKPVDGIPSTDLAVAVRNKIADSVLTSDFTAHADNNVKHITAEERSNWNAQYTKPATGIPETDLEQAMRTKINGMVSSVDFNQHNADTVKHVSASERTAWNAKYDKPNTGIPLTDLSTGTQAKINEAATVVALNNHSNSTDIHVSTVEKVAWNAKYVLPTEGMPLTDLEDAVQTKINDSAEHVNNVEVHVTSAERKAWNEKYAKPAGGISDVDLAEDVVLKITESRQHVDASDVHITTEERTKWNAKYDKPVDGITSADLAQDVVSTLDKVDAKYTRQVVAEDALTSVTILASEHNLVKEAFEYLVVAYSLVDGVYTSVQPTVKVDATTKDITVEFTSEFVGAIVVR